MRKLFLPAILALVLAGTAFAGGKTQPDSRPVPPVVTSPDGVGTQLECVPPQRLVCGHVGGYIICYCV